MNLPFDSVEISRRLLAWYGKEGRELPWRSTRDPYRIWLSEIMLQQTTVAAVIPYYQRFLARFPTLEALAAATLDDVVELWAGLGYYSRARNLHQTARQIAATPSRTFPDDLAALVALPGIGRSTAGAILSIAFDKPAPILDGNVRRVLVRLFAWTGDPRSSRAEKQLWIWAEALTSTESPHDYAQAIMDLGATVCTPREPDCDNCPLRDNCQACEQGLAAALPIVRKKKNVPLRRQVALIIRTSHGCLLRQRPQEGLLGGLWEFPAVDLSSGQTPEQAAAHLLADLALAGPLSLAGEVRHAYSHFKLALAVFAAEVELVGKISEISDHRWCRESDLAGLPLHGAHRKAYDKFKNNS